MAEHLTPIDPQRLRHGHGRRLLRRDFADQVALDDQLRWWHNRALHDAYGVAAGLDVTIADAGGTRTAFVGAGLAYDRHGRELPLRDSHRIAVPAGDATLYLVLAHDGTACPSSARHAPGPDGSAQHTRADGLERLGQGVTLRWVPATCDGVPLAVSDAEAVFAPPRARPFARPRIGHGATVAGQTRWRPWTELIDGEPVQLGVEVEVDTSAVGFTGTPCYFVQVGGAMWTSAAPLVLLGPIGHVTGATRDRFTYRLLMPWLYLPEPAEPPGRRRSPYGPAFTTGLVLSWIGIEEQRDDDTSCSHRHERRSA
ncbi:hypothetical protein [Streptosporangium sp. KLBMP 9127]|nr:hypothetical protein [Streptosporangium sp. KLBMP 9127]